MLTQHAAGPRKVMALSSQVAHGHVGLSAAVPVLHLLGCAVTAVPTVMLSNHPGWPHVAGHAVPPGDIDRMIDALEANGWLAGHDALLTGYLPGAGHVDLAARLIARIKALNPGAEIVVDPVLGDAPKGLYIDPAAASAIRDQLVPLADIVTPNMFELGWLTGRTTDTLDACRDTAQAAATAWGARVLTTSAPAGENLTGCLDSGPDGSTLIAVPLQQDVPHGVGDVFSALIAAGRTPAQALGHLQALIAGSLNAPHLRIVETAGTWCHAPAL